MKVKYLIMTSWLLVSASAHAIEIMPINPQDESSVIDSSDRAIDSSKLDQTPINLIASPPPEKHLVERHKFKVKRHKFKYNPARRHSAPASLEIARKWINNPSMSFPGKEGSIMFTFGASLPTLYCTPLFVCGIRLQPGEVVIQIDSGDSVRWHVTPSVSGSGPTATTSLMVKPTDSGLKTNLSVATNRRRYNISLVSTLDDWMPEIAFSYPEEPMAAWANYTHMFKSPEKDASAAPAECPSNDLKMETTNLNFDYKISGDEPSWLPLRVFSDGTKTYIDFPKEMCSDTAPALVLIDDFEREQLVNYRMINETRYMVDKVIQRAALVTGAEGEQIRVEIDRKEA